MKAGKNRLSHSWNIRLMVKSLSLQFPAGICMFKVNNRNTRKRCEICSNLTIKTPERRQWRRSGVFIVCFEHISHLVLVFLLLNAGQVFIQKWKGLWTDILDDFHDTASNSETEQPWKFTIACKYTQILFIKVWQKDSCLYASFLFPRDPGPSYQVNSRSRVPLKVSNLGSKLPICLLKNEIFLFIFPLTLAP